MHDAFPCPVAKCFPRTLVRHTSQCAPRLSKCFCSSFPAGRTRRFRPDSLLFPERDVTGRIVPRAACALLSVCKWRSWEGRRPKAEGRVVTGGRRSDSGGRTSASAGRQSGRRRRAAQPSAYPAPVALRNNRQTLGRRDRRDAAGLERTMQLLYTLEVGAVAAFVSQTRPWRGALL